MAVDDDTTARGLARIWRRKPFLLLGFAVVVTLSVFFGARTIAHLTGDHPRHEDIPIKDWMTPSFISNAWDVDKAVVREAIGITENDDLDRAPLGRIARQRSESRRDVAQRVREAVAKAIADPDGD